VSFLPKVLVFPVSKFKGQTSITIQAPLEKVYAYLVDFRRHPEWAQNLSKVQQTSSGPMGVGTTFRTHEGPPPVSLIAKLKMMMYVILGLLSGAKPYSIAKITILEANRRIAWQAGIPKGEGFFNLAEWEFVLEPQGTSTRLTQYFHWKPQNPTAERMVRAASMQQLERSCAVSLQQLKRRLEQESNSNP
jgi:uncharacterized protein YndB with AHSA1/START domain